METQIIPSRFILNVLAALFLCTNAAAATPSGEAVRSEAQFSEAMDLYSLGKWAAAYGRFAALADQGHAEAARIALLMLRHGSKLYGASWGASQPQINQWMKLALQRMEELKAESGD
jgi:hypothetical protein